MNLLKLVKSLVAAAALIFPLHNVNSTQIETISQKDLYCLTKNIYHEARGESFLGKLAVAQVTINRANNPQWPNTICDVVYQKIRGIPQFSWTTMPVKVVDNVAWQEATNIAYGILSGTLWIKNFTFQYFHNTTVEHGQKRKHHRQIGNHIFYN
jgi:spore germination cell wall hydrolase CwlJ-like protein